jgi:sigma-B regulation protein RsbU (phosphoserine phosphatase)
VKSQVLLCAKDETTATDLQQLLAGAGHAVHRATFAGTEPGDVESYRLILLETNGVQAEALKFCKGLRSGLGDRFVPTVVVTDGASPQARLAGLEAGADACIQRPLDAGEFLAQINALLRMKEQHEKLLDKTAEANRVNKQLQLFHERMNQELELARRIQQSLLPLALPQVPGAQFAVHYQPCDRVGGDFYDIFRLDENHVGLYVADAMGHGIPACLLTMFLKKAVRPKEIRESSYRLVPPGEVLQRLNRDLMEQGLAENPFITMVYALFNFRDGVLQFARAGHPYPLRVPNGRDLEKLEVPGSLLGVFETQFVLKVLFFTDGTDAVSFADEQPGAASVTACAAKHRGAGIAEFVGRLAAELRPHGEQGDDITFLGLEWLGCAP